MKKFYLILCSGVLLVLVTGLCFASGAYTPKSGGLLWDSDYQIGKSIFNGSMVIEGKQACVACHVGKNKIKRNKLRKFNQMLMKTIAEHPEHIGKTLDMTNKVQLEAVVKYLRVRYKVN